ncbi:MAG TPA: TerB family tellurite resistance protein [Kofleriaceae bacterium]|nr:TerB family tellurite resistance protein [Kofleriaceae bacterium]
MNANMAKCLVVSKVLVADGIMTDDERGFLAAMMDRLELTEDERRSVVELEGLDEADRIVGALSAAERSELIELLVDAASADGRLSPHELVAVKRVSDALGL